MSFEIKDKDLLARIGKLETKSGIVETPLLFPVINPAEKGLHSFLDFDRVIMTDSGAYQILVYGDVEVSPAEIVEYQERIGSDIATILDIPTGWKVPKEHAAETVNETLK